MPAKRVRNLALALFGLCLAVPVAFGAEAAGGLKEGKPDLKSAGPLAFGPDGILFVGDTAGAALFAIDTGDKAETKEKARIEVKDISGSIAKMLGTTAANLMINDLAVNPRSGNVYLSVTRGQGRDAAPLLVRVKADGKIEEVSLENIPFAKAEIPKSRRGMPQQMPRPRMAEGAARRPHAASRSPT